MFHPLSWKLHTIGIAVNAVFNFSVLYIKILYIKSVCVAEVFYFCLFVSPEIFNQFLFLVSVCYTGLGD